MNRKEAIPLEEIALKFKQDSSLQTAVHMYLNAYNSLCRGIEMSVFDEEVIKKSRGSALRKIYRAFEAYIEQRRKDRDFPTLWSSMQRFSHKWSLEDNKISYREPTGGPSD